VHGKDRLTFAQSVGSVACRLAKRADRARGSSPARRRRGAGGPTRRKPADFFLGAGIANLVRVPLYPRNSREAHPAYGPGHTGCKGARGRRQLCARKSQIFKASSSPTSGTILVRDQGLRVLARRAKSPEDPMLKIRPEDNYIIRHNRRARPGRSKGRRVTTHKAWLACNRDWFSTTTHPSSRANKCLHMGPISHAFGLSVRANVGVGRLAGVMVDKFEPGPTWVEIMEEGSHRLPVRRADHGQCAEPRADGGGSRDWSKLKCMFIAAAPILGRHRAHRARDLRRPDLPGLRADRRCC